MAKVNHDFLPQDGRYDDLIVYRKSECICDVTYYFCQTYMNGRKDRTVDQMLQAARSGKQNIVEGTSASSTSKETEIKLLNVAKASHQELLEDYKDYLRHNGKALWSDGDSRYERTRKTCKEHNDKAFYNEIMPKCSDEMIANIAITLIHQVDVMLMKLIEFHKQEFLKQGGIREEMARARKAYRQGQGSSSAISNKQRELDERERRIALKEQELAKREQELSIREDEIKRIIGNYREKWGEMGRNRE